MGFTARYAQNWPRATIDTEPMKKRLCLALAALTFLFGTASAQTVSLAGQTLDFGTPLTASPGTTVGASCLYDDVVTVSGTSYDAIITITAMSNALLSDFDATSATNSNTAAHFSPQVLWTGPGEISYSLQFIQDGTGGAPVPVTLGDFSLTAWDLDGVGVTGSYFSTSDLTSYALGSSTVLTYSSTGSGQGSFTNSNAASNTIGTDGTSRVSVGYSSVSTLNFAIGSASSGSKTYLISGDQPSSWFPTTPATVSFPNLYSFSALSPFFTCDGVASTAQSVTLEGRNLTAPLQANAPSGWEISTQMTQGFSTSLSFPVDSTGRMDTTVYVRMTGSAPATNPSDLQLSSTGASSVQVSLDGTKGGVLTVSNFTGTNPSACGTADGSITFNIANVVDGSYTVSYRGGSATATVAAGLATLSGLEEGHYYDLVLTDGNGCSSAQGNHISLTEPIDFTIAYAPTDKSLCVGSATTFGVVSTGAATSIQWYLFSGGMWTPIAGATAGTYTTTNLTDTTRYHVRLTSVGGCRWTSPVVTASVHPTPTATATVTPASCPGTADGSIDLSVTAGQTPISYLWNTGATTEDLNGISSGTYTVTLLDPIGCQGSAMVAVSDSDGIAPTVYAMDITVQIDSTGTATITPSDLDSSSSDNCSLTLNINKNSWTCAQLGTDTVMLWGTDGNQSDTAYAVVTVVDTVGPVVDCIADTTVYVAIDTSGASFSWADATVQDPCGVDSTWATDTAGSWFLIGTHTITTYGVDIHGNVDSCSFVLTVSDTLAPTFMACLPDTILYATALECGANFTWNTPTAMDNSDTVLYSATDTSGSFFAVGVDTVRLFAQDLSGNTDTCLFLVTVRDTLAPTWDGTLDTLVVQASLDTCGVYTDSITLSAPTIVEACGLDTLYNNANSYYPLGAHDVYWYATDPSGNMDSILQKLIVEERFRPEIYCPGDTLFFSAAADSTQTQVTWTGDSVWDNCGIDSAYFSLDTGSYLPVGLFKIDYFAYDLSGNGDTCSFFISISDTTAPAITGLQGDTTIVLPQDTCLVNYSWALPTIEENTTNYTSGSNYTTNSGDFGLGSHTVYYTVEDAAGFTDSAGFTITVVDQSGPQLLASTQVLTLDNNGFATLTPALVDSGSFDCSGIDSLWLSDTLFVCFDVGSPLVWFYGQDSLGFVDSIQLNITILPSPTSVITSNLVTTDALCFGEANGTATVNASGGSPPYSYAWTTTGDTTQSITGLAAGTYNYHVNDTNGCVFQANFNINEPPALVASVVGSNYNGFGVSVEGANDGTTDLTVTGGTTPYSFSWNNGFATTEDLNGLFEGTYFVVVTDSNGCTTGDTVTLTEPDFLRVQAFTLTDNICPDDLDGSAYVSYTGGAAPFTVTWSTAATTDTISGLASGTLTVVVVDANGVVNSDSTTVIALDEDCDGILNTDEGGVAGAGGGMGDFDGDGIPNQQDTDSDGDGISDALEWDSNGDGIGFDDCDGDGFPNFLDPDPCTLYPATVVTPNGDGRNDTWEIPGLVQYPGSSVKIFNRHGRLVYESANYENDFSGNANVQTFMNNASGELPTGTYYYYLTLGGTSTTLNGYFYINK